MLSTPRFCEVFRFTTHYSWKYSARNLLATYLRKFYLCFCQQNITQYSSTVKIIHNSVKTYNILIRLNVLQSLWSFVVSGRRNWTWFWAWPMLALFLPSSSKWDHKRAIFKMFTIFSKLQCYNKSYRYWYNNSISWHKSVKKSKVDVI